MDDLIKVDGKKVIIDFSSKDCLEKKEKVFFTGLSPVLEVLQDIQPEGLYKFVYTPEGTRIENPDGTFFPIFKKDGKFTGPGKMKEIKHDFSKIGKSIASQVLLLYISSQLNDVLQRLASIEKEFAIDRIAKIDSVIKTAELHNYKFDDQNPIIDLEQKIIEGVSALEMSFQDNTKNIPNANATFTQNWVGGINKRNEKYISERNNEMYWILRGYDCLFKLCAAENLLSENEIDKIDIEKIVEEMCSFLSSINYAELIGCSRSLPYSEQYPPEKFWQDIEESKNKISVCDSSVLQIKVQFPGNILLEECKNENGN